MLSVSLQANHLHSSAGPDIQADDVTCSSSTAGRKKQFCTMTVLRLELLLNSVRKIITENGGVVFLKLLISPFQVSLPYKVKSLRKPVHFNLLMLFFQDKSYFRCPGSQRTLSSLALTYHSLQKTSLQIKDVIPNIKSHDYHMRHQGTSL